jgi:hypothetical protein
MLHIGNRYRNRRKEMRAMTCKDCIHYEACDISAVFFGGEQGSKAFREYEKRTNVQNDCDTFKDKSKIVELPCRVGDTVYVISRGEIIPAIIDSVQRYSKKFFLTASNEEFWGWGTITLDINNEIGAEWYKTKKEAMKHGKRPTRQQKKIIKVNRLNPDNWLVSRVYPDRLEWVYRYADRVRVIQVI